VVEPIALLRSLLGRVSTRLAARLQAGDAVLDVGCGRGDWLSGLARRRTDLILAGVDRRRGSRVPTRADFAPVDLEAGSLPYPANAFRLVVCAHVLEHLHDPGPITHEIRRVLAPDGRLYVEVPSERTERAPSMPRWFGPGPALAFRDDPTHVGRPWSPGELNEFLGARAFDVIRSGRARSPALWPASGPLLAFGVVGRDARAAHRALEQIAGLASYAVARPA